MIMTVNTSCTSKEKDYSNWEIAVATVTKLWAVDGGNVTYVYYVNSKQYKRATEVPSGTIYYDRFLILYNPDNPSESEMANPTPFFHESDSVRITEGEITNKKAPVRKYKDKFSVYFGYKYYVNGAKHKRDQHRIFCEKPSFELKKGDKYKVIYDINNPQRSVMILGNSIRYIIWNLPCEKQFEISYP